MIIFKDKSFLKMDLYPDTDWLGNADWVVPDDSELAEKIKELYPNFEFVFDDNGNISDVVETEPAPVPPAPVPPAPPTNAELAAAIAELAGVIMNG